METNDPIEPLPEFTQNTLLEEASRERLPFVFPKVRFKIREEQTDVGIDIYIELRSARRQYLNARFVAQVKSREDSTANSDGSFSKSIETSNLFYLLRSEHRAMYIFYVEETNTYFYEWADVFRDQLNGTNPNWRQQGTNTLRFHKLLDEKAVDEIFNDIKRRSDLSRQRREGISAESVVESFHAGREEKYYKDIIWSLTQLVNTFEGLSVLPGHILSKLPPFSMSAKSRSYFVDLNYTLYTDNRALFDFFADIKLEGENYVRISDGSTLPQESMRDVLNFLEYNFINHISPVDDRNDEKRVCVHKLFHHQGCDCERCSLKKLRWGIAIEKLSVPLNESIVNHSLRRGIVLVELGKIRDAFELYKRLADQSLLAKRYVAYIVAKFHLVSCGFLIRNAFHVDNSDAMEEEVTKINLQLEIEKIAEQNDVRCEVVKVLKWLVGSSYYLGMYVEADLRFRDAVKSRDADERGHVVSTNHYQKLSALSSELTVFVEGNAFHVSYFNGLGLIVLKVIEAGLIQFGLKNPMAAKVSDVHPYFLHLCFTYCESEKLNELFNKYKVKQLSFGSDEDDPDGNLIKYIDDLLSSLERCREFIVKEFDAGNAAPKRKLNNQLKVAMLLVSVASLPELQLNEIVKRFLNIAGLDIVEPGTIGGLRDIFSRQKHVLAPATFQSVYKFLLKSKTFDRILLTQELPFFLREAHPEFIDTDPESRELLLKRKEELKDTNDFAVYLLMFYALIVPTEIRRSIGVKLEDQLSKSFDSQVYYLAAYHDVIGYEKFLPQLIAHVPRREMAKNARRSVMGYDDFRNDDLDRVITLGYKYGFNLKAPEIQALAGDVDYYQWLLNLDTFDYDKFNPYWLLFEPNVVFVEEFRKHDKIRASVKEYLTKSQVSRLKDIYIEYFT
jgi:hypothetical protein